MRGLGTDGRLIHSRAGLAMDLYGRRSLCGWSVQRHKVMKDKGLNSSIVGWLFGSVEIDRDETLLFKSALIRLHESGAQSFGRLVVTSKKIAFHESRMDVRHLFPPWWAGEPRSVEIPAGQLSAVRYINWPGGPAAGRWGISAIEFVGRDTVLTCQVEAGRMNSWRRAYPKIRENWTSAMAEPPV